MIINFPFIKGNRRRKREEKAKCNIFRAGGKMLHFGFKRDNIKEE